MNASSVSVYDGISDMTVVSSDTVLNLANGSYKTSCSSAVSNVTLMSSSWHLSSS